MKIGLRFFLVIGLLVACLLLVQGAFTRHHVFRQFSNRIEQQLASETEGLASSVMDLAVQSEEDLKLIVAQKDLETYFTAKALDLDVDMLEASAHLESFFKKMGQIKPHYAGIAILDSAGRSVLHVERGSRVETLAARELSPFVERMAAMVRELPKDRLPIIHQVRAVDAGRSMYCVAPVIVDGHFDGIVALKRELLPSVGQMLADLAGKGIVGAALDASGAVVATSKGLPREFLDELAADRRERFIVAKRVIPMYAWTLCLGMEQDKAYAVFDELTAEILSFLAVSLVASFLILWGMIKGVTRPLLRLVADAERIAAGNLDHPLKIRQGDEIGTLADSLRNMIDRLKGHIMEANGLRLKAEEEARKAREALRLAERAEREGLLQEAQKRELEQINLRLREMDALKSSLLSSVSHDLRTPLTSILGFAKLIKRDFVKIFGPLVEADPKLGRKFQAIQDDVGIIEQEGERLTRLINDFLDLSKIESGRIEWRDADLEPEAVIRQSVAAVQGQFAQNGKVGLEVCVDQGLPSIHADPDRLVQVLVNLLNNAAKFTPEGSVTVSAGQDKEGSLLVQVEDTGIGVPAEDLEKIFDKFQQLSHKDLGKPLGSGLGLSICREIVRHYGGRIWAESEPGHGSTFKFTLPYARHAARTAGAETAAL